MSTNCDEAVEFFFEVVEPTVEEFLKDPGNKRRGFQAASVLSSMADYHFHATPSVQARYHKESAYRASVSPESSDYALVCDVANAGKHAKLTVVPKHRALMLSGARDVAADQP